MPLISKGEKITCTNGHVIGEALDDVSLGDLNWGAKFGNWTQDDHPKTGSAKMPVCAQYAAPRSYVTPAINSSAKRLAQMRSRLAPQRADISFTLKMERGDDRPKR